MNDPVVNAVFLAFIGVLCLLCILGLAMLILERAINLNSFQNIQELIEAGKREEAIRRLFAGWGTYWIAPPGSPWKTNQEVSEENRYRMQLLSQHFSDLLFESPIVAELIELENQIQPGFDDVELMERHGLFVRLLSTKVERSATSATAAL